MTSPSHLTLVIDPESNTAAPAAGPESDAPEPAGAESPAAESPIAESPSAESPSAESPDALTPVPFDEREYRDAVGAFASGVTVITTHGADGPVGFTCQSFYSVSIDPPLVSFSIARTSKSLEAVRAHRQVVVNFLGAAQQQLSGQFARSGTDKWQGVAWHPSALNGAPTLDGVIGWVAGEIEQEIEAGDHLIFLVRVAGLSTDPQHAPLVFYRGKYHDIEYQI